MKKVPKTRLSQTGLNHSHQRGLQVLLCSTDLSFKAKGIFFAIGDALLEERSFQYLLSIGKENIGSIRSGVRELEEAKLLYRLKCRKNNKFYRDFWLCWPEPFTTLMPQHQYELEGLGLILDGKGGLIYA